MGRRPGRKHEFVTNFLPWNGSCFLVILAKKRASASVVIWDGRSIVTEIFVCVSVRKRLVVEYSR